MKKSKAWSGAFVCIFNISFSKTLLLERKSSKKTEKAEGWGNIGGSIESGETPLRACVREVEEEIGVRIEPKALKLVQIKKSDISEPQSYVIHFFSTPIEEGTPIKLDGETHSYKWFSLKRLPSRLMDDSKDIIKWRNLALSKKNQ
ncbi:MAG: NUDIX hydrolase [Candidatus Micrarchaeota archaeon]|nr:NUDIX hydrolase [Candidatus Micrarchaeota archaeon]